MKYKKNAEIKKDSTGKPSGDFRSDGERLRAGW